MEGGFSCSRVRARAHKLRVWTLQAYTTYDVGRRATQKLFRMLGVVVPIMTGGR